MKFGIDKKAFKLIHFGKALVLESLFYFLLAPCVSCCEEDRVRMVCAIKPFF